MESLWFLVGFVLTMGIVVGTEKLIEKGGAK